MLINTSFEKKKTNLNLKIAKKKKKNTSFGPKAGKV